MSTRALLLLSVMTLSTSALAGCFGGGGGEEPVVDGSDLPPFEATLFLNNVMFHPFPGGMLSAWAFSEQQGASTFEIPTFRVVENQLVRITFVNTHEFNHTIHWHGLHVPWGMDGVPYVTQDPVLPGSQFTYEFRATPAGTHFFHCHVDTPHHTDMGMYGVLIVEPAGGEKLPFDSEQTLVFDDWDSSHLHQNSNTDAEMTADSVVDDSGNPFNQVRRTEQQAESTWNDNPNTMAVRDAYRDATEVQRDWYPETYAPWQPVYDTWTINGLSYPNTEPIDIKEGETKKLRFINVGNSIHSLHVHGHHFLVTHTDGYPLPAPYYKDTLPIHPGERYDVLLVGNNPGDWMFHDHMGLHEMNNHISPGGIMTHIVYEGFDHGGGGGHEGHSFTGAEIRSMKAGDFLGLYK